MMIDNDLEKKLQLSCADIWLGEDGILRQVYKPGAEVTAKEAEEIGNAVIQLTAGKKTPQYVDARNLKRISKAGRELWSRADIQACLSAVATNNTPVVTVLARFYIRFSKPPFPIAFFSNEEQSVDWLTGFLE